MRARFILRKFDLYEENEYKGRLIFLSENTAPLCSEDKSNLHEDN